MSSVTRMRISKMGGTMGVRTKRCMVVRVCACSQGGSWREQRAEAKNQMEALRRAQQEELEKYNAARRRGGGSERAIRKSGKGGGGGRGGARGMVLPTLSELEAFPLITSEGKVNVAAVTASDGARASLLALLDNADDDGETNSRLLYVGLSRNAAATVRGIAARRPHLLSAKTHVKVAHATGAQTRAALDHARERWIEESRDAAGDRTTTVGIDVDQCTVDESDDAAAAEVLCGLSHIQDIDAQKDVWEKPLDVVPMMREEELREIHEAKEEGNELKRARLSKAACRRVEAILSAQLERIGVQESFRYDPKLKAKGLLDISMSSANKRTDSSPAAAAAA